MDDVVTFPGRMYAFINYRTTEEAMAGRYGSFAGACCPIVPELTGDRRRRRTVASHFPAQMPAQLPSMFHPG